MVKELNLIVRIPHSFPAGTIPIRGSELSQAVMTDDEAYTYETPLTPESWGKLGMYFRAPGHQRLGLGKAIGHQ